MKILLSADFEGNFSRLFRLVEKIEEEMICISCGDIFDYHHHPAKNFEFPTPFFSVKGNKDLWGGDKLHQTLSNVTNFFWLTEHLDKLEDMTGLRFFGIDFMHEPKSIPNNLDVLISHRPAYGLADQCNDPRNTKMFTHCGSKAVRSLIDKFSPSLFVAGHLHYFQFQQTNSTLAVTLAPNLSGSLVWIENKSIIIDDKVIGTM